MEPLGREESLDLRTPEISCPQESSLVSLWEKGHMTQIRKQLQT